MDAEEIEQLKIDIKVDLDEAINSVFIKAHRAAKTKSGDIFPEQQYKLDKLQCQIAELILAQTLQNLQPHTVSVRDDCPDGYWYSNQKGKEFKIKTCHYSDLRDVEGFGSKEPNDCWKVSDGEFAGNVMLKAHCL